ncbi:TonB-dependent receptor plug domain-containing protein [Campylobacter sp. MIT 19-121]|uniref:TonB-dependent receptor plug domain-containing protein n=1 Tax=Campylobacter sp. MIT 19-121 TaxID=2703906 RepID=UPI001389BFD2|nr:TonB-dependent receptor plug domain-containing protein [Campylobacter sp. MIT 19-121]NDJ27878.1 TonB-dependent receptor plug domain-containing protein [Campylobacter sp. MIT 19-121]
MRLLRQYFLILVFLSNSFYLLADEKTQDHKNSTLKLSASVITAQKDILDATNNTEFSAKNTLLQSGDLAKSFLNLPGFSMARKGGGGSEIFFRSQGASRLPIFINGGILNGGCGGRMDTSISYIFAENYDTITTLKGPQDVRFGNLISGGVLFDRDIKRLDTTTMKAQSSVLYASFNQLELNADMFGGNELGSLRVIGSRYSSNDYETANKQSVHSAYKRESLSLIGTLTPFESTGIELDADFGKGFASYADRAMDGRAFDRTSFNLRVKQELNTLFEYIDFRVWHNEIDHIMDNFSHRPNTSSMFMLSNPKRTNSGFRTELNYKASQELSFYLGTNYNHDKHSSRSGLGINAQTADTNAFSKSYTPNYLEQSIGGFLQGQYFGFKDMGVFFGTRYDELKTLRYKTMRTNGGYKHKSDGLVSAFVRLEHYQEAMTLYAGAGYAQRGADYWEINKINGEKLKSENNAQLDFGAIYKTENLYLNASFFASRMYDYILINWANSSALQTNAKLYGGEIEGEISFDEIYHFYANLSYTYAQNTKTNTPLPRIAPLQTRFAFYIDTNSWLLRLDIDAQAAQTRYAKDYGNVVGRDFGRSAGFYTANLYGGYKNKNFSFLLGIDNLTNTLYAYHLSKNSVEISMLDNPVSQRVFEPGRSMWAKFKLDF